MPATNWVTAPPLAVSRKAATDWTPPVGGGGVIQVSANVVSAPTASGGTSICSVAPSRPPAVIWPPPLPITIVAAGVGESVDVAVAVALALGVGVTAGGVAVGVSGEAG